MLTVNELFSGIGSQSAALERLGIEFKVVGIAEIDKYAIKSYEAIHGATRNYGDISVIDKLDYADFWTYSFPCQDISVAGLQRGINENTRSGLLYQVERLLEVAKDHGELPKYLMLENVKNLVGKKFKPQFEEWLQKLDQLGYTTQWQVLNAKNYGIPQNRERVFAISIRKDIDMGYEFPIGFDNGKRLKDILETEADEKFYLNTDRADNLIKKIRDINISKNSDGVDVVGDLWEDNGHGSMAGRVYNTEGQAPTIGASHFQQVKYILDNKVMIEGRINSSQDGIIVSPNGLAPTHTAGHGNCPKILQCGNINPSGHGMNGNVFHQDGLAPTLTTNKGEGNKVLADFRIRKLTPHECYRLMGFTDEQFHKAAAVNSNSQLYKQAGNSIVVDVLYHLFQNLFINAPITKQLETLTLDSQLSILDYEVMK